jgi:sugar phosphate isomerase/epimerase
LKHLPIPLTLRDSAYEAGNMKIAAFADEICREDPTRALQLARRWGIDALEIRTLPGGRFPRVSDAELAELGRMLADTSLTVSGVSPGLFKCSVDDEEIETGITELLPRACEWARTWGTDRVSIFATGRGEAAHGSQDFPPRLIEILQRMCRVADTADCRLVLENEAVCWGDTGTAAAALIRAVGDEHLSLCWDPGNSARAGSADPLAEYGALADLVSHVHLKNFDPSTGDWALMDTGIVDWPAQFRALANDGYAGHLVVETHTAIEPAGASPIIDASETLSALESNSLRNLQYTRSLLS